jgi:hypothetical protein
MACLCDEIDLEDFNFILLDLYKLSMNTIDVRQPKLAELASVEQLRHNTLDPARLIDEDHQLSPQDFESRNIHMAAFSGLSIVGTVRLSSKDIPWNNVSLSVRRSEAISSRWSQ